MNIFTYFKKNKITKANESFPKLIDPPTFENQNSYDLFDSLEEKFIRIDILIGKCKLILQDKFELDISKYEIANVERIVNNGLNESRQNLIDNLLKHRDQLLKEYDPKIKVGNFLKFKKYSRQPTIDDYLFSTYFNLDHRLDLVSKIKYLKLFYKSHEVMNKKKSSDFFNNWYADIDILPLSENSLLYFFKSAFRLEIRDIKNQIISKRNIDFETLYVDCFDYIYFKANSTRIVCLRHIYNRTLILIFDMILNELKRLLVVYKSDSCLVNETEILLKETNSNKYHLYNFHLEELPFGSKINRDESIIKLTDEKVYSFYSQKGMNILKIASRSSKQSIIQLSLFTKQPINRDQIKLCIKRKCIIVLDKNRLKLFGINGSFICESEKDIFFKTCDSIELVNDFDQSINKNTCIYLINRYKNTFYLI